MDFSQLIGRRSVLDLYLARWAAGQTAAIEDIIGVVARSRNPALLRAGPSGVLNGLLTSVLEWELSVNIDTQPIGVSDDRGRGAFRAAMGA